MFGVDLVPRSHDAATVVAVGRILCPRRTRVNHAREALLVAHFRLVLVEKIAIAFDPGISLLTFNKPTSGPGIT